MYFTAPLAVVPASAAAAPRGRRTPPPAARGPRRAASVCRADSSSSRCSAKPTWTMAYSPTRRSGRYSRHTSLRHAAEVDGGHAGAVAFLDVQHFAGYRQAHGCLLAVGVAGRDGRRVRRRRSWPSAGRRRWAGRAGGAARVNPSSRRPRAQRRRAGVGEDAAAERDRREPALSARSGGADRSTRSATARWKRAATNAGGHAAAGRRRRPPQHRRRVGAASDRRALGAQRERVAVGARRRGAGRRPSSSIAACASYPARWHTPASEATASKSRPMLEVGTQPEPRCQLLASTARSSGGQAPVHGSAGVPRAARPRAGGPAPSGRGAHAGVAAGQRT